METDSLREPNEMPFARYLGLRFRPAPGGGSDVSLEIRPELLNTQGIGHGGLVPILVDAAGATAVLAQVEGAKVVTADLRAQLIGSAQPGDTLTARGTVMHLGTSTAYASVVVSNQTGAAIGLGQVTCIIRRAPPPA